MQPGVFALFSSFRATLYASRLPFLPLRLRGTLVLPSRPSFLHTLLQLHVSFGVPKGLHLVCGICIVLIWPLHSRHTVEWSACSGLAKDFSAHNWRRGRRRRKEGEGERKEDRSTIQSEQSNYICVYQKDAVNAQTLQM